MAEPTYFSTSKTSYLTTFNLSPHPPLLIPILMLDTFSAIDISGKSINGEKTVMAIIEGVTPGKMYSLHITSKLEASVNTTSSSMMLHVDCAGSTSVICKYPCQASEIITATNTIFKVPVNVTSVKICISGDFAEGITIEALLNNIILTTVK
jgi:hypothetical protein